MKIANILSLLIILVICNIQGFELHQKSKFFNTSEIFRKAVEGSNSNYTYNNYENITIYRQ